MIYEITPKYKVGDAVSFAFTKGEIINIRLQKAKGEYWFEYLISMSNGEKYWECEGRIIKVRGGN